MTIIAARYEPLVKPNVFVGPLALGGLRKDEAAFKVRSWWEQTKRDELKISSQTPKFELPSRTATNLGVTIDDAATVAQLPFMDVVENIKDKVQDETHDKQSFEPIYKGFKFDLKPLELEIRKAVGPTKPATVKFVDGQIVRTPETSVVQLDSAKLEDAVISALKTDHEVKLPLKESEKSMKDEELAKISDVISTFTTHFPTSKKTRCANIKLASSKINGLILMPGDKFSFNTVVGRRTIQSGFQIAGVFKNGKHDIDVGGGICQVSTTLYNAAIFADLQIKQRSNHSMAVPYVPIGRDATVDYGTRDLIFQNNTETPIAVTSEYKPGALTFRLLGKKDPGLSVKITSSGYRSWSRGVQTVGDATVSPGKKKVVDAGGAGHEVTTYRSVYKNGQLVRREVLAHSKYPGSPKIVAVSKSTQAPALGSQAAPKG